ncbi:MAG: hypothetical protein ACD_49C00044G0002 [uncultured bacterium (gcode 4)]|uniref:Uncharacterized protein n=1 Tax=uncultured bacterium (gcode 4) TaxID=1234023 RepID=K2AEC2_9BACT|nr:MAG: hypothetical protein ACD_49C00044G0002 [uncultured bacterium (gcode 4)]HBA44587.1 hypothetical protein [Candidatus Gracilibacteria bacterium]HBY75094.1 hypothetical protein [Candidatus Gracilibacteria bacterium]
MSKLEERFLSQSKTEIQLSDKDSQIVGNVLKKAIIKGDSIQRGGIHSRYSFVMDGIYNN